MGVTILHESARDSRHEAEHDWPALYQDSEA